MYIGKTRNPITVILLSLVTCGIYYWFWLYTTMDDLNKVVGREVINPTLFLILCIFVPFVPLYVFYTIDKNFAEISKNEGVEYKENFILWVILYIALCGIGIYVGVYQLTEGFNNLWAKRSGGSSTNNASTPNAF